MPLFEPDPTARQQWVQVKVEGVTLSIRLTISDGFRDSDGTLWPGGMTITDFRAPGRPDIDWAWIDRHSHDILFSIPLGG